ncbi:hypothetical protein [Desulfocastanea catecholica]
MDCLVDLLEQDVHLLRPLLPVLLRGTFKVAQVVGVAEAVYAAIIEVGFSTIIREDGLVVWQNLHFIQRSAASFGMVIKIAAPVVLGVM